jgi:hypothetical protein
MCHPAFRLRVTVPNDAVVQALYPLPALELAKEIESASSLSATASLPVCPRWQSRLKASLAIESLPTGVP